MRDKKALLSLISLTNEGALEFVGKPFTYEEFGQALEAVRQTRYAAYIYKRIGHLPDIDFVNLIEVLKNPSLEEEVIQEALPPLENPTINEESTTAPRRGRGRPKTKVG